MTNTKTKTPVKDGEGPIKTNTKTKKATNTKSKTPPPVKDGKGSTETSFSLSDHRKWQLVHIAHLFPFLQFFFSSKKMFSSKNEFYLI